MHLQRRLVSLVIGCVALTRAGAEISVSDDLGRVIRLASLPQRVVSLAPSITETLFAIGDGDEIVGVTNFCNYPPEATTKARIGGIINPSIETIIGLKPDLIVLSMEGNVREDFNKLLSIGCPVFVTNPRSLLGIRKSIEDLGQLTGKTENAARLVKTMQQREDSVTTFVKTQKRVMLIVSLQPLIVAGSKTFLAELINLAGGVNIASGLPSTYPTLSREAVVEANPEVIIIMVDTFNDTDELLQLFPEWKALSAVNNHQVFRIEADITSRPGPRAIDGLVALYKIIHEGHK